MACSAYPPALHLRPLRRRRTLLDHLLRRPAQSPCEYASCAARATRVAQIEGGPARPLCDRHADLLWYYWQREFGVPGAPRVPLPRREVER